MFAVAAFRSEKSTLQKRDNGENALGGLDQSERSKGCARPRVGGVTAVGAAKGSSGYSQTLEERFPLKSLKTTARQRGERTHTAPRGIYNS